MDEPMNQDVHSAVDIDNKMENVAGQELMLKWSRNGLLLVPQPSDDPHDPLNFTSGRKALIF